MCLGLPGRIVSVEDGGAHGQVEVLGTLRLIDLSLLTGPALIGEHILIHSGVALQRISVEQAAEAGAAFRGGAGDDAGDAITVDASATRGPPAGTPRG